jgi:hypothetical protein
MPKKPKKLKTKETAEYKLAEDVMRKAVESFILGVKELDRKNKLWIATHTE